MPSTKTATESPSWELALFLSEQGLLRLPVTEIAQDIRREPELYYPDHMHMRKLSRRNSIPRRWWVERCARER